MVRALAGTWKSGIQRDGIAVAHATAYRSLPRFAMSMTDRLRQFFYSILSARFIELQRGNAAVKVKARTH
jgi:hypothetical protein